MRGWRWAGGEPQRAGECQKHLNEMQQAVAVLPGCLPARCASSNPDRSVLWIWIAEVCQGTAGSHIRSGLLNRHRNERTGDRVTADEPPFYILMVFTTCVDSGWGEDRPAPSADQSGGCPPGIYRQRGFSVRLLASVAVGSTAKHFFKAMWRESCQWTVVSWSVIWKGRELGHYR